MGGGGRGGGVPTPRLQSAYPLGSTEPCAGVVIDASVADICSRGVSVGLCSLAGRGDGGGW